MLTLWYVHLFWILGSLCFWLLVYICRMWQSCKHEIVFLLWKGKPLKTGLSPCLHFDLTLAPCLCQAVYSVFPMIFSQTEPFSSDFEKQLILILVNGLPWFFVIERSQYKFTYILFSYQMEKYVPYSLCPAGQVYCFVTHCHIAFIWLLCHHISVPSILFFMRTPSLELKLAVEFA